MDVNDLVVEGYAICKCGQWLTEAEAKTSDLCASCLAELKAKIDNGITAVVEGEEIPLPPYAAKRDRKPHSTKRDPERARLDRKARRRAQQRLADIHAPLFQLLLEQEKAKLGLYPKNIRRRPPLRLVSTEAAQAIEDYVARNEKQTSSAS